MTTAILPEDLLPNYGATDILLYDYYAAKESSKQQVDLSMNTISFLQEGQKEVFSDFDTAAISNSNFLLMKAGKCLMTETFSTLNQNYRSVLLFFTNQAVIHFTRKYEIALAKNTKRKTVQAIPYDTFTKAFVNSLVEIQHLSVANRTRILQVKFEELMLYMIDVLGNEILGSLLADINDNDLHFQEVIESNKLNKLTLKELAFLSNMSVSTFKRKFESHYKTSPSKWFQERRLEYAAHLLKHEQKRPSDIFEDIGYETLSNFVQAFKAQFGKTPKQFQSE